MSNPRWEPFKASFAREGLAKMAKVFDASVHTIVNELAQNARRAGADRIEIQAITQGKDRTLLTVEDNGAGIEDPRILLRYGASTWGEEVNEDTAGMGMLCLTGTGCTVESATRGGKGQGFSLALGPEHFEGGRDACAMPRRYPEDWHGTRITALVHTPVQRVGEAVGQSARFLPVEVVYNGRSILRGDFLSGAQRVVQWNGVRIGIMTGWGQSCEINFHGVRARAPSGHEHIVCVKDEQGRCWTTMIDVVDAPWIELVLPGRHRLREGNGFECLKARARYETLKTMADQGANVAREVWDEARTMGIDWPEPRPLLTPYQARTARGERGDPGYPEAPGTHAVIVPEQSGSRGQMLARALAGKEGEGPLRAYGERAIMNGYPWYDKIPRLKSISVMARWDETDVQLAMHDIEHDGSRGPDRRPDRVWLECKLTRRSGEVETAVLETDLALPEGHDLGNEQYLLALVTRTSGVTAEELTQLYLNAYFDPSDAWQSESDSQHTQRTAYAEEAMADAIEMLHGRAHAVESRIRAIVERELMYVAWEADGKVRIEIEDREVNIEIVKQAA